MQQFALVGLLKHMPTLRNLVSVEEENNNDQLEHQYYLEAPY